MSKMTSLIGRVYRLAVYRSPQHAGNAVGPKTDTLAQIQFVEKLFGIAEQARQSGHFLYPMTIMGRRP
jgi:hypothetical protein